jgi:hypothetical protein
VRTTNLKSVEQYEALFKGMEIQTVAKLLPCSPAHVRNLIKAGALAAVNVGLPGKRKEWRVSVSDYERFVKERAA